MRWRLQALKPPLMKNRKKSLLLLLLHPRLNLNLSWNQNLLPRHLLWLRKFRSRSQNQNLKLVSQNLFKQLLNSNNLQLAPHRCLPL
jgi:hypothetical protein